jgi:hypothetical protein
MMPNASRVGTLVTADLVRERRSATEVAVDSDCEDTSDCAISGTAATDVDFVMSVDGVTTGCATAGAVDNDCEDGNEDTIAAVVLVSELVGASLTGGFEGAAAT